jgi:DNA polymerase (family 10)
MTEPDRRYLPQKVRRPREEVALAVEQLEVGLGFVVAGSWRRQKATVGDLDILVPHQLDFRSSINLATNYFGYEEIRGGALKSEGLTTYEHKPLLLNFWRVPTLEAWGGMLLFCTGPYDLNISMRARAKAKGWTLSQYGLFDGDIQLDDGTEERIFELLRLQFLAPVEREDWRPRLIPVRTTTTVEIRNSKGTGTYTVTLQDGKAIDCECQGFAYRSKCRHLAEAEGLQ